MNSNCILERYHSQNPPSKLWDARPKSIAVILLTLNTQWRFYHADAPFLIEVWSFPHDFSFEVAGEFEIWHARFITSVLTVSGIQQMRQSLNCRADALERHGQHIN